MTDTAIQTQYQIRQEIPKWPRPPVSDDIPFAITEAGEDIDADLRKNPQYSRNHTRAMDQAREAAQCYMMILDALSGILIDGEQPPTEADPARLEIYMLISLLARAGMAWEAGQIGTTIQALRSARHQAEERIRHLGADPHAALAAEHDRIRAKFGPDAPPARVRMFDPLAAEIRSRINGAGDNGEQGS